MDASDSSGSRVAQGQLFSNTDLSGLTVAFDYVKFWSRIDRDGIAYFSTSGFERLVEAIAKGDLALKGEILRRWRVR